MKNRTKIIKRTNEAFAALAFDEPPFGTIAELIDQTKTDFDQMAAKIKLMLVEFLLFAERESLAGPNYAPIAGWQKWGTQPGFVYAGGQKLNVNKPRLRKNDKEAVLPVSEALGNKKRFSS